MEHMTVQPQDVPKVSATIGLRSPVVHQTITNAVETGKYQRMRCEGRASDAGLTSVGGHCSRLDNGSES